MQIHSIPETFKLDKYSYLNFIFDCCDYVYNDKNVKQMQKRLFEIIRPELSSKQFIEAENLIIGIKCETKAAIVRAISDLDCVRIEL